MKNLRLAYRSFFKNGQNNLIKILSLGTGLAVGLVLISKVYFENTYDDFYPHSERIYQINTNITHDNTPGTYRNISGGVAPGMRDEIPGVEAATRVTTIDYEAVFFTGDEKRFVGEIIMADSCFFDVLPRPMIAGVAKEILSRPMYVMVSRSVAEKMGGNPVGQTLRLDRYPDRILTIGGIFEDVPENTELRYDAVVSLASISNFFLWDGSMNWDGNDRYHGYVRLTPGTDPQSLAPAMRRMQERHQDLEAMKRQGVELSYSLLPLTRVHSDAPEVKRMTLLLSLIAFSVLFTALMNYIIIVISTLAGRTKEVAVYKCYGATERDIARMSFVETAFHLVLSLLLAALLVAVFRNRAEEILQTSLGSLFGLKACLFLFAVCVVIAVVTALIPSYLFSRIPVAAAFRSFKKSRRSWMLGLLFIQFLATAFLVTLIAIVGKQYHLMIHDDPGYAYEKLVYADVSGAKTSDKQLAIDRLNELPGVDGVATAETLPFEWPSGNNVSVPGSDKELFNMADLYGVDEHYFGLMEIPVIDGKAFTKETSTQSDMMISRSFAKRLTGEQQWTDGVAGKTLSITEHGMCTVTGVYDDIRLGAIGDEDRRPSAVFYAPEPSDYILIKTHTLNGENISKIYDVLKEAIPDKDIVLVPYQDSMIRLYKPSRLFAESVMIGAIVTLVIALIGLIGYTNNETNRRKAEIAVRKVNGATLPEILSLFIKNVLWIAVPALVIGGIGAAMTAETWMQDFSKKAEPGPLLFLSCGIAVLIIILAVITVNCYRAANQNPANTLKNE